MGFLGGLIGGLTGWITLLVIVFTMLLLMAMDAGLVPTVLKQLYPVRPLTVVSLVAYGTNVRRYMVVTTILGLAQGFVNFIALVILQVPGAFIWGLLAFICSFIPNIGYFIAIIPPIVFGALVGGWPTVIAVIVVYGVINAVIQSIIQPRVVGRAVSLSQTITFFSVLFWAVVIGPIGAILAIPLTLLVRLMLVDTNPSMTWIRPLLGEFDETKQIMAEFDAQAKAERKARRAAARAAGGQKALPPEAAASEAPARRRPRPEAHALGAPAHARAPRRSGAPSRANSELVAERLRLERVELALRDRALVEQRLGLRDLIGRVRERHRPDVLGGVLLAPARAARRCARPCPCRGR